MPDFTAQIQFKTDKNKNKINNKNLENPQISEISRAKNQEKKGSQKTDMNVTEE